MEVAEALKERFPDAVLGVSEFRGQVSVAVRREALLGLCRTLHDDPDLSYDFLADLCGVDYLGRREPRFEVVYNLYSMQHRNRIILTVAIPEGDLEVDSVVSVWTGANWHEREAYDMYGIVFRNHPDLRRVLMPEDWTGYPLRKDYPVKGPAQEWEGYEAVKRKAEEGRRFEWKR